MTLDNRQKIERISEKMAEILEILGLDPESPELKQTPQRVAKMYVEEVFDGLNRDNLPPMDLITEPCCKGKMIIIKGIKCVSFCEHHLVPMVGNISLAFIPATDYTLGFAKLHQLVKHIAHRPQLQERLTENIAQSLCQILSTEDVAVHSCFLHFCALVRGHGDASTECKTSCLKGSFQEGPHRQEFFLSINN